MGLNNFDFAKAVGEVIGARIVEMLHNEDIKSLQYLGLNRATQRQLSTINPLPTHINYAVSKSLKLIIDEQSFINALKSVTLVSKIQAQLNNWIKNGASFEMCRNFFSYHTSNKHLEARAKFCIANSKVMEVVATNEVVKSEFYDYLWQIEQNKGSGKINANDLDVWIKNSQLTYPQMWRFYKEYFNNKKSHFPKFPKAINSTVASSK